MKNSVWQSTANLPRFDILQGDKKTDVLIVGGGIAGLICAHLLERSGIDYILAEAGRISCGITKNTTAKITIGHGLIYDKLIRKSGSDTAKMYFEANKDALDEYARLCKTIPCAFETKSAYTYSLKDSRNIEREVKAAESLGIDAAFTTRSELPFDIKAAVRYKNQAQFNPLQFISGISKGLNIYENTFIQEISKNTAISDKGRINFNKIIVCTHFPFINKHGNYFVKLYQHRSYVSAYKNAQNLKGMYVDEDIGGLSFRTYDGMLLIGGGSHRTGKDGGNWNELSVVAQKYYPDSTLKYMWATQDCMTLDSIPYAGLYSKRTPNMYVATGFNKWGMTNAMACAKILCDLVQDRKNDFAPAFSPDRSILTPQLFINGFETLTNLISPTVKRCPHLGCALKWNKHEHTWDCPCHGSRFEKDGTLIDNPATGDANI